MRATETFRVSKVPVSSEMMDVGTTPLAEQSQQVPVCNQQPQRMAVEMNFWSQYPLSCGFSRDMSVER